MRLKLDHVVLILRDDAYGMIKWKQANMGFDDFGLDYGNPDFVLYANSYGAQGHRVASAQALLPLLEECFNTPGVHLVEAPVDYSDNDRILNRGNQTTQPADIADKHARIIQRHDCRRQRTGWQRN